MRSETKKVDEAKKERAIVPGEKNLPRIPDEKIDQIISLSDDQTIWVKTIEGGFKIISQDKFVKSFVGKIIDAVPYLIHFENGVPTKLPNVVNDLEVPEGYERRVDVKLLIEGEVFGLSLPPSTSKFYFSPYLKFLKNKGLRPEEVLTKVTSKQASNSFGVWSVACFELAETPLGVAGSSNPKGIPAEWD